MKNFTELLALVLLNLSVLVSWAQQNDTLEIQRNSTGVVLEIAGYGLNICKVQPDGGGNGHDFADVELDGGGDGLNFADVELDGGGDEHDFGDVELDGGGVEHDFTDVGLNLPADT
jgi:hypothetical protein